MDKLLQKLRQNMAELSLQGDDFTRQIWQMYATFEEFIDHQQSPGDGSPPRHPTQDAPPPPPAPSGGLGTVAVSPARDATTPYSRVSPTMSVIAPSSVSLPNTSARLRQKSPSTTSDDLALASPRRSRRRRPRRLRRSVDNPLLDTISTIGGDSDEEPQHHHIYHSHSHNLHLRPHSPASCPRLHLETDIIGYAGSNSVDSGYKSACPTPDLPDLIYPEHRLEKRGSLASLASSGSSGGSNTGSKPRIPMGTRVMSRGGGIPRSPGTGVVTPTKRPGSDSSYYESDQLVALRQALLGSPTEGEGLSLGGTRYSPRVSPATTLPLSLGTSQRDYHVSRRAASPASPERRPRSASTGSRCSPGAKGTRKALQSGSPHLASTGSLPRATSPGRRPSLSPAGRDDNRPPPVWSRHSSPGMSTSGGRGRRPPSPIVGVDQVHENELTLLEREIDVLLYGGRGAQYYDLDSGREFPCPFSNTQETPPHSCRPALASVRRLREEVLGTRISLLVNDESRAQKVSKLEASPSKEVELKSKTLPVATSATTKATVATTTTTTVTTTTIETTGSIAITTKMTATTTTITTATTTTTTSCQASSGNPIIVNLIGFTSDHTSGLSAFDVAKCALRSLGMLGEIQKKDNSKSCNKVKTSEESLNDLQSPIQKPKYRTTPYPLKTLPCLSDESSSESSSYSDFHLYEEILYDTSKKPPTDNPRPPSPPPLPKRPPVFQKSMVEFRGGEVGALERGSVIGNAVIETLVRPSLKCCRCPGESITRKQLKRFSKPSTKLKTNDQGDQSVKNRNSCCVTICDDQLPPVPPIRTTSQMNHGNNLSSLKLPVPPSPPFSATSFVVSTIPLPNGYSSPKSLPLKPSRTSSNLSDTSSSQNNDQNLKESYAPHKEILSTDNNISSSSSMGTQTCKPKQRHNLYSIFKDKHHRRFLSASLELEYHHQPELTKDNEERKKAYELAQSGRVSSITWSEKNGSGISESTKLICSNNPQPTTIEILKDTSLEKCDSNPQRISFVDSQITIASKVYDNPLLLKRESNRIRVCHKACSLDLNPTAQVDDEYGFQALSNVV
ncbi:UNVERIFIED_CONTAM: hypothetical protein RMT77_007671 [Armadillidium vulgare]